MTRAANEYERADHDRDLRKADPRPRDGFDVYVEHCREIGQTPPTREWWDATKDCSDVRRTS